MEGAARRKRRRRGRRSQRERLPLQTWNFDDTALELVPWGGEGGGGGVSSASGASMDVDWEWGVEVSFQGDY
jgi:hypothetical protein